MMERLQLSEHGLRKSPCVGPVQQNRLNDSLVEMSRDYRSCTVAGKDAAHHGPLGAGLPDVSNDRWPVIIVVRQNATEVLEGPDRFQSGPVDREDMLLCGPGSL